MLKEPDVTLELLKYGANRNLRSKEGYQWYQFVGEELVPFQDSKTDIKARCLEPHMHIVSGKTVLDIGCDKGYFFWFAKKHGALSVTCNEIHKPLIDYLQVFCKLFSLNFDSRNLFREQCPPTYDVTMSLAMIHQVGEPLYTIVDKIRSMTKGCSIIEFFEDYSQRFGSQWNLDVFKKIVLQHYNSVDVLCDYEAIGDYKGRRYLCHARCSH